jgi:hypothetical protein
MSRVLALAHLALAFLALAFLAWTSAASAATRPANVEQFFVEPDQPAVLRWQAEAGAAGSVPYRLFDYTGKEIGSGEAKRAASGAIEASVRLGRGYYEIPSSPSTGPSPGSPGTTPSARGW